MKYIGPVVAVLGVLFVLTRITQAAGWKKLDWKVVCPTPDGYVPQGLDHFDGDLYLTAHKKDAKSSVFRRSPGKPFELLFDMPPEATHTSGFCFADDEGRFAFAVDYHSHFIYLIDVPKSVDARAPVIVSRTASGLKGTSACCIASIEGRGKRLIVTDFRKTSKNFVFKFDLTSGKVERDSGVWKNYGFSQGIFEHDGLVYETGNQLFGSYAVKHSLKDTLTSGKIKPIAKWKGPARLIEDLCIMGDKIYLTDEGHNMLYSARIPEVKTRPGDEVRNSQ